MRGTDINGKPDYGVIKNWMGELVPSNSRIRCKSLTPMSSLFSRLDVEQIASHCSDLESQTYPVLHRTTLEKSPVYLGPTFEFYESVSGSSIALNRYNQVLKFLMNFYLISKSCRWISRILTYPQVLCILH